MKSICLPLHKFSNSGRALLPCQSFSPAARSWRRALRCQLTLTGSPFIIRTLFFLFLIYGCQTTRVSQKSIKTTQEITDQLRANKQAKTSNRLPAYHKALNQTEDKLQSVFKDLLESESVRVKQEEAITDLKDKLSTWTSIKVTFWILITLGGLFGGFVLVKKFKPSFLPF